MPIAPRSKSSGARSNRDPGSGSHLNRTICVRDEMLVTCHQCCHQLHVFVVASSVYISIGFRACSRFLIFLTLLHLIFLLVVLLNHGHSGCSVQPTGFRKRRILARGTVRAITDITSTISEFCHASNSKCKFFFFLSRLVKLLSMLLLLV